LNITRDQTIGGVPAVEVRNVLRHFIDEVWEDVFIARMEGSDGAAVLAQLVQEGYLESPVESQFGIKYELTTAGHALQHASAAKPVKRATAQKALDGLLVRVEEVNADPRTRDRIRSIVLFGSFLDEAVATVSDVDLAIELERVGEVTRKQAFDSYQRRRGQGAPPGPDDVLLHGDVFKILKGRSPILSLVDHREHEAFLASIPHRQIYPRP
jgi:predicted nucleotidyltransferase